MDGREMKQRAQTAREMTEEIDRVADIEAGLMPSGGENARLMSPGDEGVRLMPSGGENAPISAERARGIGGVAMGHSEGRVVGRNAHEMMGVAGKNLFELEHPSMHEKAENERVMEIADVDNGYARNEFEPNLSSVGGESRLEEEEWSRADNANLQGELNPQASFDARIQNKKQEEIGEVMAGEVGKMLHRDSFVVSELESLWLKGMKETLASFKVPRVFGARNNS